MNYAFFVAYIVGLSAFGSFVNDMFLPSLPSMCRFFDCSVPTVQLALTFGMIGLGLGQFVMGPISDKYGRKPVLFWSLVLFVVAAVVSIFSPTIHFFIGCRFFQGVGASGGYFLARTLPADVYQGRTLAKTMALIGAINGFAPASAPVLGGLIADRWDWQGVFVTLTICAVVLILFSFKFKETLPPDRRDKGSLGNAFALYKDLLVNKPFMIHTLLKGAALGILFAYVSSAPFIIQTHFGFSKIDFGLIMGANSIFVVGGSLVALRFKTLKKAAMVGAITLMVFTVTEAAMLWTARSFIGYELLMLPILFSLGLIFTSSNTLAMNEGRNHAGDASAVVGIGGYIFGAIVSPLVGMGDIMHSTGITFVVVAAIVLTAAILGSRLPAEMQRN